MEKLSNCRAKPWDHSIRSFNCVLRSMKCLRAPSCGSVWLLSIYRRRK